jgi:glucose/arabinose dehydrogenase
MALDPISGDPFVTENGPESFDEVNHVVARGNYGWPVFSGPAGGADTGGLAGAYREPLLDYPAIVVPTGIAFADPDDARPGFGGDLFFATYGEGAIHRVRLDESRNRALSDDVFLEAEEPLVAVAWGPEGIYYSTSTEVKLIPLAATGQGEATRGDDAGASPDGEPEPEPTAAVDDSEPAGGYLAVGIAALVLAGVLAFVFWRRRPIRPR